MLIGKHIRLADYEPSFAPFITEWMNDPEYWGPSLFRGLEIWYQVHPTERGHGVATQAAAILVDHLFSARPHQRVQATVVDGNDGSRRVLEHIGMTREGVLRQITFLRGQYVDMHPYSIVRDDWKSEADYRTRFDFLESQ